MKFSSVSFIAVVMRPLASSHFGKSVGGISVSPVLVCVCFDLYNDDRWPTDETSLHHWPANRRRYDVIHRQDVHPTVEWTLPKTFARQLQATRLFRYTQIWSHRLHSQRSNTMKLFLKMLPNLRPSLVFIARLDIDLTNRVWSMRLRLDRGSSVPRHSREEISSHASPNNELIRVQIDDDTIQK